MIVNLVSWGARGWGRDERGGRGEGGGLVKIVLTSTFHMIYCKCKCIQIFVCIPGGTLQLFFESLEEPYSSFLYPWRNPIVFLYPWRNPIVFCIPDLEEPYSSFLYSQRHPIALFCILGGTLQLFFLQVPLYCNLQYTRTMYVQHLYNLQTTQYFLVTKSNLVSRVRIFSQYPQL